MPALHEIPAPVTTTERFAFDMWVESVDRRSRCSVVGASREMRIVIVTQATKKKTIARAIDLVEGSIRRLRFESAEKGVACGGGRAKRRRRRPAALF
jgi:hypothetical protein